MPVQTKTKLQTYHATMVVTRAEEWCVEATSPEEATALLQAGQGHRCSAGEIFPSNWMNLIDSDHKVAGLSGNSMPDACNEDAMTDFKALNASRQ